jgi:putative transposase
VVVVKFVSGTEKVEMRARFHEVFPSAFTEMPMKNAAPTRRVNRSLERQQKARTRRPYPSDITDDEWRRVYPLISGERETKRGRPAMSEIECREVVNALFFLARTGCQWAYLPHEYPEPNFVYQWFRKWGDRGLLAKINHALRRKIRVEMGREEEPWLGIIDSQTAKCTEMSGVRGYDGGKKIKGVKRHIVVDSLGLLLMVVVHSAGLHDAQGAYLTLCAMMRNMFPRLAKIMADAGYGAHGAALGNWLVEHHGWVLEVVKRTALHMFKVMPQRWKVERTFAWFGRYRRLSKHYEQLQSTAEAMVYLISVQVMLHRSTRRQAGIPSFRQKYAKKRI